MIFINHNLGILSGMLTCCDKVFGVNIDYISWKKIYIIL